MTIDEEIKQLLDRAAALKNMAAAETQLETATAAYRADPTDENKAAYKAASDEMVTTRQATRADREGVGVGGDAFIAPEGEAG